MNRKNMSRALLWMALLLSVSKVFATDLSNSKILGAIPQSFDNIGIIRYVDMNADTLSIM